MTGIKRNKDKIYLFFVISIILYIVFSPYVKELLTSLLTGSEIAINKAFIIESDWIAQHIPFYKEFFRQIESGRVGWSWNELFGINFYGSKGYYLIGDPFSWITFVLYRIFDNLHLSLLIITLIKFYISCYAFYYFLQMRKVNRSGCFIFSIMFMLSGWQTLFLEHPVYTSFYCIAPFVLIGIENILLKRSYPLFIISAALMLSVNYYLSWMFCWLILIYWIVRFSETCGQFNFRIFIKMSLKTLASFIIAIALSAIVWIPSVFHMFRSPRIDHELITYTTWNSDNILSIIMNFFVPVTKEYNLYQFYWYYFYQIGIYCSVLNILLLPQLFGKSKNKNRKLYQVMVILALLTLVSPLFGKLFHFTYSLRYSLIIEYTLLICGSMIYNNIKDINVSRLWLSELFILIILFMLGIYVPYLRGLDIRGYPQAQMLLLCCIFSVLYCLFISLVKKKKRFP